MYAFFRTNGARIPAKPSVAASDTILKFDADVEAFEIEQACDPESALRSFPESNDAVSKFLLARCKR